MTSVRIDEEVLQRAKKHGINVSSFLEFNLRTYLAFIEGKGYFFPQYITSNEGIALREGFEPSRGKRPTGSPGLRLSELGYLSISVFST